MALSHAVNPTVRFGQGNAARHKCAAQIRIGRSLCLSYDDFVCCISSNGRALRKSGLDVPYMVHFLQKAMPQSIAIG
jgi:hypothetical protein